MTQPTIAGIHLEHVTVGGNLTISGVTIQLPRELPPLWVNVPILPREFMGRDELVADLVARLLAGQSTALSADGLPGVGKTALAVVLAHHPAVLAYFADGVLWAGLGPQGDAMSALTAWGTSLGVDVTDKPTLQLRSQAVRNAIGQRRILLVVDDAWDLAAAEPLRCGGPGCAHLLTTRDQGLARAFAGSANQVAVPELEEDPALELLRRLAPEACAVDPAAASRLARSVGGLPLALELVGGFLAEPERSLFAELSAEAWGEMSDPAQRLQLATVRLGAVDGQQVTLQETIALSLAYLPQPAVDAFYALGAFAPKPATFDLAAAKAVTEAGAATLATLVARSLVERGSGESLALHQTIADVARTALPLAAVERHRDYYLALVDDNQEDWERIRAIYAQVQQALAWQVKREPNDGRLLDFYGSLRIYLTRQGLWQDYGHLTRLCLNWTTAHRDHRNQAILLHDLGTMHSALGDTKQAIDYYNQSLFLRRQLGDRAGEAAAISNIGDMYRRLGDMQKALEFLNQALPIRHEVDDRAGEANTLNCIGVVYYTLGDPKQALYYYNQALNIRRQVNDEAGEAVALHNIGTVHEHLGDLQRALYYYNQALPIRRQVGDRTGEATALNNIGTIHRTLGHLQHALDYYTHALSIYRQMANLIGEATTLNNIGGVHHDLGGTRKALDYYNQALEILQQIGDKAHETRALNNIGAACRNLGDMQHALECHHQALALSRQVGSRTDEGASLHNIGVVYQGLGNKQQALAYYRQALPVLRQVGNRAGEAMTFSNLGFIHLQQGETDRAVDMLRQAIELDRATGAIAQEAGHSYNLAVVLHHAFGQTESAIALLSDSIAILQRYRLPQDANGATLAQHQALLQQLQAALPSGSDRPKRS